jgi:hypothetical protein
MVTSVTKSGTQKLPKKCKIVEPTDMTIHWKALEEQFLMLPLFLRFTHFWGKNAFSEFFLKKTSVLKELNNFEITGIRLRLSSNIVIL